MRAAEKTPSRESLADDFRALGVEAGDTIMLHASFKSVRPLIGGPDAVLDGLLDALTPSGSIVMFASWERSTYDAFASGGLSEAERASWPAFVPATAPVRMTHGGAVGACLARRPGALRSRNPDRSLLGIGSSKNLLEHHNLDHGFGLGSPLEALCLHGAKTLNLGAPLYTATILHYAEYLAEVPDKRFVNYEVPILENGRKIWKRVTQMDRDAFVAAAEGLDPDYLEQVIRAYLETDRHSEGRVGAAQTYLFGMQDLVSFAVRYFEDRFG